MKAANPVDLLFDGMEKLGPKDDVDTSKVLNRLPKRSYRTVVDAGCGAGRQTLVLANRLGMLVHAVDSYEPFLASLMRRAKEAGIFRRIDLLCRRVPPTMSASLTCSKLGTPRSIPKALSS